MPGDLSEEQVKDALKSAFKEWLDDRYAEVGKWTIGAAAVAAFGALVWLILTASGWHRQ